MWFEIKLAFRFVFFRQKGFYTKAKFFTIATIAISVAALLVSLSAFRGYIKILSERYSDSSSHIIVSDPYNSVDDLKLTVNNVLDDTLKDSKYFGYLELIVSSQKGIRGLVFEVVEDKIFKDVVLLSRYMKKGSPDCVFKSDRTVIVGSAAAELLSLDIGSPLKVLYAGKGFSNNAKEVTVCGIVDFGLYDLDSRFAYISIQTGSLLFPEARFDSSVKLRLKSDVNLAASAATLSQDLPPGVKVRSWKDINYSMFEAVKMDRLVIFFILSVLIAVSIFNVLATLILLVRELKIDISILQVLGLSMKRVLRIFFMKSIILGLSGFVAGVTLWGTVLFIIQKWGIIVLPKDVYLVSSIPVEVGLVDLVEVLFVVLLFSCAGSIFPLIKLKKNINNEGLSYGIKGYRA